MKNASIFSFKYRSYSSIIRPTGDKIANQEIFFLVKKKFKMMF